METEFIPDIPSLQAIALATFHGYPVSTVKFIRETPLFHVFMVSEMPNEFWVVRYLDYKKLIMQFILDEMKFTVSNTKILGEMLINPEVVKQRVMAKDREGIKSLIIDYGQSSYYNWLFAQSRPDGRVRMTPEKLFNAERVDTVYRNGEYFMIIKRRNVA